MIDWDKGKDEKTISSVDFIQKMEKEMDEICKMLSEETKSFKAEDFFARINKYVVNNERLLYTHITNYIFLLSEEQFGILQSNLDSVIQYMGTMEMNGNAPENEDADAERERTQKTIIKIWDHVNLARKQYILFCHKDEDYEKIVDEKMEMAEAKISKEMNIQLISLVAIFTALSFLVFGGISSLDNIFSGVQDIPIIKLLIIGCIWCFYIMNLIFTFMFFVAKITKLSVRSTDDVNANIIKKYPLVWWSNYVIISVLCLGCWLFFVYTRGYDKQIDSFIRRYDTCFVVVGTIAIGVAMVLIAKKMYKMCVK